MTELIITPKGIRPATGDEPPHTLIVIPTGDGEFRAACSSCLWSSFGTYASPRATQLREMFDTHRCGSRRTGRPVTRECGTVPAYKRHLRHGEDPCTDCKAAWAEWHRDYYARKRNL